VALEELASWVRDDNRVQVLSPDDVTEALREGRRSFELFRSWTGEKAHRAYLEELPYGDQIFDAAEHNGLDSLLVAAVVQVESQFRPRAVSAVGAVGLMQVMPDTGALYGVHDLTDPTANLEVGTRYFSELLNLFSGDLELALAAYNAGPGAVKRFGGVPPYPETRSYVDKVLSAYVGNHRRVWSESGAAQQIVLR
jgi:soluble lytic murein transglycosylase-like protein